MVPNGGNENRVLSASRSCPATSFLTANHEGTACDLEDTVWKFVLCLSFGTRHLDFVISWSFSLVFDPLQQSLQTPRAIPGRNPFQCETGGPRRVDAIVSRGRGAVAGRHHPTAHVRVPVAVRIAEVFDGPAEQILQLLLAREDFLAPLLGRKTS